jgi:hypothetical protein
MGWWGPGNFDGDSPRDFLADIVGRWEQIVDRLLAGEVPEEAAGFEFAPGLDTIDGAVMPTIEILITVAERLECDYLPGPEKVARWAAECLRVYDAEIGICDVDADFRVRRRQVLAETFDRLASVVRRRGFQDNRRS